MLGGLKSLPSHLPDRLEVEPILEARIPVTIFLTLDESLRHGNDGVLLAGQLHGLQNETDKAEIVQIDRVGEDSRLRQRWRSQRQLSKDLRCSLDKHLVRAAFKTRDQQFGRLFGAVAEADLPELPGGPGAALGQLKRVTRKFQRITIDLWRREIQFDQTLNPAPEAAGLFKKPSPGRVGSMGQQPQEMLLEFWVQCALPGKWMADAAGVQYGAGKPPGQMPSLEICAKRMAEIVDGIYSSRHAATMAERIRTGDAMHICLNRVTAGGGLPFEGFLELASHAGFAGADVDMGYGQKHGAAALRDLYAAKKLKYGGWGLPADFRGDQGRWEEGVLALKSQAKIAAELGIDSCATWLMPSSKLPFIENWLFHVARLKPAAKVLADCGLRLGLEFIGPFHLRRSGAHEFVFTPGQMLELADAIAPNVGLLVDSFHTYTSGTPFDYLATLPANRIVLVHLNDAPPGPLTAQQDSKRLVPGEGVMDLNAFMGALQRAGYAGPVSVEVFSDELKKMPAEEAAAKTWAATKKTLPKYTR